MDGSDSDASLLFMTSPTRQPTPGAPGAPICNTYGTSDALAKGTQPELTRHAIGEATWAGIIVTWKRRGEHMITMVEMTVIRHQLVVEEEAGSGWQLVTEEQNCNGRAVCAVNMQEESRGDVLDHICCNTNLRDIWLHISHLGRRGGTLDHHVV